MSLFASRGRKALIGILAATTLAGTVSITTTEANAWGYGYGYGYGAAALAGGLALGAIAAGAAASSYNGCYITQRRYIDGWGYEHFRRVRVCD